jgi:chaperonin GroES
MATKSAHAVKVNPLADRVVVRPMEEAESMRGGLYIPDTAKEKPQVGEIVAAGPGRYEKDKRVPMEVKVGDKVLYGKYSGTEVTLDNEQYLILRESDVLAIVLSASPNVQPLTTGINPYGCEGTLFQH